MLKKLIMIAGAAIGGIYLTSEEGKNARATLLKKKSTFEPIVKDLLKQANEVLEGSKSINSKEVKANIDLLVDEAKNTLVELDLDKAADTIKEAIKVSSKKIRIALNEAESQVLKESKGTKTTKKVTAKKTTTKKTRTKKTTSKTNENTQKIKV